VSVSLDVTTASGLAFVEGHGYRIGQIGSFIRIPLGYVDLYGIVAQVGAGAVPDRLKDVQPFGNRWMTVELIGEGDRSQNFSRGISQYPTIGDPVHLVTERDLSRLYGRTETPELVRVGRLASAESIPALIDANSLVARHSAVVGTTGAGKSTTVASLVRSLASKDKFPNARCMLIDIHGEYGVALNDCAQVFRISSREGIGERPLHLPYWALTYDELIPLTFGSLQDAERGAIGERIVALKAASLAIEPRDGMTQETVTVDSPVPFSLHQLWFDLYCEVAATHSSASTGQSKATIAYALDSAGKPIERGNVMRAIPPKCIPATQAAGATKIFQGGSSLNIRRQLEGLGSKLRDPRYDFLFRAYPNRAIQPEA